MHFSFSKIFIVSRLILGPTLSISLFPYFSLFSCYISAYTVFVSHFPRFSGFFSFFFLKFSLYILHFFTFFIFLTIFQVLQCAFFIFHVFKWFFFFCHIPGPRVSVSHYSGFFSVSRQIPDHTVFVSHFPLFSVFLTYSRSYSVRFSFFTFLEVSPPPPPRVQVLECVLLFFHVFLCSRHSPDPTVCIFHFSRFSVFLAIIQVIPCLCLIYHLFRFSHHIPSPTVCVSHFPRFSAFSQYSRA